jgi:hypothetical protein
MRRPVVLAPVPWEHLESAESEPHLLERVFFGSSSPNVPHFTVGLPVFIYGSQAGTRRVPRAAVTWGGTLGAVERAVERGPRSGKFHDSPRANETCATSTVEISGRQGRP